MSLAIGLGILYALVVEGLLSAFAQSVNFLEPLTQVFLRANGYSIATALGAPTAGIESNEPGSFGGPCVDSVQGPRRARRLRRGLRRAGGVSAAPPRRGVSGSAGVAL